MLAGWGYGLGLLFGYLTVLKGMFYGLDLVFGYLTVLIGSVLRFKLASRQFQPYWLAQVYGHSLLFGSFDCINAPDFTVATCFSTFSTVSLHPGLRSQLAFCKFQPYQLAQVYGRNLLLNSFDRIITPSFTVKACFSTVSTVLMHPVLRFKLVF